MTSTGHFLNNKIQKLFKKLSSKSAKVRQKIHDLTKKLKEY